MEHLSRIFAKAGLTVDNGATFNGLVNANTDTDRFLVADNGVLKFRTGAEILSDIGGASSASGLPTGGTAGQILAKIDATNYNTEWIDNFTTDVRQYVKAGEAINKGQAVYISSADGTNPIVSKASNASEATSSKTLGLLAQNLSHNGFGYVITEGRLSGLDTSSAQIADPVWLGTNGNLIFGLANKPIAPAHLVYLGVVTRVNANNGEIFVHVQNGVELNEIHDVLIQSVANKDIIYRDASTNLWKNASIATVLGFTPADNAALANYQLTSQKAQPNGYASLDGNGKVPLAQMNDSIIGQVEYMGLWNAATNTPTLSSTPQQKGHYYIVSAAGTQFGITFEIGDWIISDGTTWSKVDNTDAVNSVFGRVGNIAAAEADYQSFYPRLSQVYANPSWISELAWSKITGTPTTLAGYGITDPIVITSGSYSNPSWITALAWSKITNTPTTLSGYGISDAVPSSRTITINGTTYDLSANRSWTISEADTLATVTARGNTTSANVFLGQYLRTGSYPHFGETVGGLATLVGNNVLPGTGVNKIVRYAGGDNGTYIILRYNAGIIFGTALASTVGSEVDDTSAEAMRITTNRNVLINTSVDTGDYRLDANGFFRLGPSTGHNISIGPNYQFKSLVSNTIITQDSENISLYANNTGNIVLGTQAVPRFAVNNNGTITASSLSGTGTRMVVSDSSGVLSTQAIPVGTVTSVGLSTGTSGTDVNVSGSPVTGSGVITLNIPTASATNRGLLSTADWTTFNNKVGGSGTINYLSKFTASGTIGNSQLFDNGTNVEIGYGSAQGLYKLDVNGSVRVNTNLYVVDAIGIGVAPNTNRPLQILKNLNTTVGIRFENTNTGANAFSALQMGEDINATGTKFVNFLYVNSSVSRYGAYVPQGTSLINVGSGGLNLGTVGGGISFYNALLSKAGEMFSSGNWYLGTGLTPTDAGFRLDVSGTFRTSGNSVLALSSGAVLVGTSTDNLSGAKLQVSGAATFSSSVTSESTGLNASFRIKNTTASTGKDWHLYSLNNGNFALYNNTDGSYAYQVTPFGNLGLGVTPSAWNSNVKAIDISSAGAVFAGSVNVTLAANTFLNTSGTWVYKITAFAAKYTPNFGNNGSHVWEIAPSGTAGATISFTQAMTLTASGNLGLGVTPSAWDGTLVKAIQLADNGASLSSFSTGNTSSKFAILSNNAYYDSGGWKYLQSATSAQYRIANQEHQWYNAPSGTAGNAISFTQAMTLDASGRLGIGTTAPAAPLQVAATGVAAYGTIGIRGTSAHVGFRTAADAFKGWVGYFDSATHGSDVNLNIVTGYNVSSNIVFKTNGDTGEAMRITSSGRTLIGTTTDNTVDRLQIAGSVKSTGNIVSNGGSFFTNDNGRYGWGAGSTYMDGDAANGYVRFFTAGSERMRITSGGEVLIGTTSDAGDYKLQVNGRILATDSIYSNGDVVAYASSDIRLKDNILPIKNALEKVKKIGGYTFDWNNKQTTYEGHDVGVIAQEIEAVLPKIVTTRDNGYKAVKYEKLTALLIESIKEQQVQIERLELLINKLTK